VIRSAALRPDGSEVPIELSTSAAGEGEDVVYTVIARDIIEQLAVENQIRSVSHGLETSNRRLAEAKPVDFLVPPAVLREIRERGLYSVGG